MKLQDARTISASELYDRRKQAILLYQKGNMTQIEIGEVVGVGRNVICEWIKKWKLGGLKALKPACSGRPVGTGRTLNASQERELQKCLIEKNPEQYKMDFALWTRSAVQGLIKELYAIDMPIRTVGHYLKQWGFTPQKPVKRAYERNDKKVKEWMDKTYPEISRQAQGEGAEIHWGDETGVKAKDQVGRGFAPKGQTPVRRHSGKKDQKINMISSITNQGKVRFMFYEGSMNAKMFIRFLRRLVKDASKKVHLILDNLPTHHSKVVKEWAEKRKDKIELHYLPSYSPDLNPDEYLNCDLKAELAKSGSRKNRTQFQGQVKSKMRSLSKQPKRIKSYFDSHKLDYIKKAS